MYRSGCNLLVCVHGSNNKNQNERNSISRVVANVSTMNGFGKVQQRELYVSPGFIYVFTMTR